MQKYVRVPLFFLFIGSLLGVFLRWQFIMPTTGVNYAFFLHGHSHIMFLGWVFNVLYIGFATNHIGVSGHKFFSALFIVLQVLVVGMLISFPLQGYAFYSILFSTLHTLGAIVFAVRFLIQTSGSKFISLWFARVALIFFILSTAGPFALGYFMATGMGSTDGYNFSIYFYLHFQYNGFFFFGILALFFNLLERKKIHFDTSKAMLFGKIFAVACIPAYVLSTLWAKPGDAFNILGGAAAITQCVGLVLFIKLLYKNAYEIKRRFQASTWILLSFALLALVLKFVLQVASAFPLIAQMAYELRPVVIAYLHLVLVGTISAFLFAWYIEQGSITNKLIKPGTVIFIVAFIGMEIILVLSPWWSSVSNLFVLSASEYCLGFASLLSMSYLIFLLGSYLKKTDKNQFLG